MTIQEMFDLLRGYRDAVYEARVAPRGTCQRQVKERRMTNIEIQASSYLPMFTPMDCKHCKHTNCNRKRGRGVCSEYEVELNKEL
jgi:hypothetical protein